jgi:hypothetical protein
MGRGGIAPDTFTRGADTTAGRFSITRFGGPTTSRTSTVSVLTTVTRIAGNNPRRVSITIYNRGVNNVDVDYVSSVTSGAGIPLTGASGVASSTIEDDGEAVINEIYGIATTGTSSVFVVEVLRV